MVKIGRNQPCPCGSGKKYKRCCLSNGKDQVLRVDPGSLQQNTPYLGSPGSGFVWVEDDIDQLSNSVVDLLDEGRLDEAEAACQELRLQYPETIDWIIRSAMVHEARGHAQQAINHYEQALQFMEAHPDDFEESSRQPFREAIARLRQGSNTMPSGDAVRETKR